MLVSVVVHTEYCQSYIKEYENAENGIKTCKGALKMEKDMY